MTDPKQHERYHVWFQRLARGIAFVGPGLLLLILLITLLSRWLGGEGPAGTPEHRPGIEADAGVPEEGAEPVGLLPEDSPTTPGTEPRP